MAIPAAAIAKAAIGVLSNEKTRKAAGWVLVAILSPIILLITSRYPCRIQSLHRRHAGKLCIVG